MAVGDVGECLVQTADDADELQPIDCDQPHDLQRFAVGDVPEELIDVADDASLREVVGERCQADFEAFVGTPYQERELDAPFTQPTAATWADGDRRYQCFVGVLDARLVGDARGSGR